MLISTLVSDKLTQVEQLSKVRPQKDRDDNLGDAEIYEVYYEQRYRSHHRNEDFMAPPYVEEIVADAKKDRDLKR